jgi:carboxymethylenebutenolidase
MLTRTLIVLCAMAALIANPALAADDKLPPGANDAKARLEKSPRHGEFVDIAVPGDKTPMKAYVVYPESKEKAPVVIVIHEIFGLSDWIRGVADQLAADGFIAVAPDYISGMGPNGGGTESIGSGDDVRKLVSGMATDEVMKKTDAARQYGMKLPASNGKTATIGFCWGGKQSFAYAAHQPELSAAVVYYGTSPEDTSAYGKIKAPVLGLYGSDDARVNKTIDPAKEAMKDKTYAVHIYDGAGHGFLRQQDGKDGANMKATQQAWPETVKFLKEHTK